MARLHFTFAFLLFGAWLLNSGVVAQNETGIWIESPRLTNWGTWGEADMCPEGDFVYGFRIKLHPDQGWLLDDTAVNAIELHCDTPRASAETQEARAPTPIRSKEGPAGNWGTAYECAVNQFSNGFELRSEGPNLDNTAANNFRLVCNDGLVIQGNGHTWGDWTGQLNCPRGMWICGMRTQVEDPKPQPADNSGLNNVDLLCCDAPTF